MNDNRIIYVIGLLLALALPGRAIAGDTPDGTDPDGEAKALFSIGTELYLDGSYVEAADAFRKAYALKSSWRLQYNIGQSEAAAKRHGLALSAFERYLSGGGDDIPRDRQEEVREEIRRLREITGALDVEAPSGTRIIVDGVLRGVSPLSGHLLVAAGVDHQVQAIKEGAGETQRTVQVNGGQVMAVTFELPEAQPSVAPDEVGEQASTVEDGEPGDTAPAPMEQAASEDSPPPRHLRTAGWVSLGAGVALLIGGTTTGALAVSKNNQLEEACDGLDCTQSTVGQGIETSRDKLALATDILIPVGAIAAGLGALFLILDSVSHSKKKESNARLTPAWGKNGASIVLEGRF